MTQSAPFQSYAAPPANAFTAEAPSALQALRSATVAWAKGTARSIGTTVSAFSARLGSDAAEAPGEAPHHISAEQMTLLKRGGALLRRLTDQPTEGGITAATPVGIRYLTPKPMHASLTRTLDERPTQAFALTVAARKARDAITAANAGDMEGAVTDGTISAIAVASSSPATRAATANAAAAAFTHTLPKVAEAVTPALGAVGATLRASPGMTGGVIAGAFVVGEVGALAYQGAPAPVIVATLACGGMEVAGNVLAGTAGAEAARTACVRYFADYHDITVRPGFLQETASGMVTSVELTPEQRAFNAYFDRIPASPAADPALNELVTLKRNVMHAATEAASHQQDTGSFDHPRFPERAAADKNLLAAQDAFASRYDALSATGQLPALPPAQDTVASLPHNAPITPLNTNGKPAPHRS